MSAPGPAALAPAKSIPPPPPPPPVNGGAPAAAPPASEAEEKLLSALREFVRQTSQPRNQQTRPLRFADALWLLVAFATAPLALSMVPDTALKNETVKFFLDKILPWFLNFGLVSACLKSPEAFIETARHRSFQILIVTLLVFLASLSVPWFTVSTTVKGKGTVWVDGKERKGRFSLPPRPHDVELKAEIQGGIPRHFHLGLGAFTHGFNLKPEWRSVYRVQFTFPDDDLRICIEPAIEPAAPFDPDFIAEFGSWFEDIDSKAAVTPPHDPPGLGVPLPWGDYTATGFKDGQVTPSLKFRVAPDALQSNTLHRAGPAGTAAPPCDSLIQSKGRSK